MTSLFDSNVRDRRNHTEWAFMSLTAFMKDMALSGGSQTDERTNCPVILTCQYRHSVASSFWWTIEWTDEQGIQHRAESQELDLCLWRAAEIELQARQRQENGRGA
jgi:hypothetical protein